MVEMLLKYGANPNYQEPKTGMTALMMCCHVGSEMEAFGIAQVILSKKWSTNKNQQDIGHNTALHHAVMGDKLRVCKLLVREQVDLELKNRDKMLAIDVANKKQKDLVEYLSQYQKINKKAQRIKKYVSLSPAKILFKTRYNQSNQMKKIQADGKSDTRIIDVPYRNDQRLQ